MNKKMAIYASVLGGIGGATLAAVVIFVLNSGILTTRYFNVGQVSNQSVLDTTEPIRLSVKNLTITQINNKTVYIQIILNLHNPTPATAMLEAIQYNVLIDRKRIASGEIGGKLGGFVDSQAQIFPVISNGSIVVKDAKLVQRNMLDDDSWNKITGNKAIYEIIGTYSYRQQTSGLQASEADRDFKLKFP